ncbi:hypothetical protein GCM10027089_59910 [Nocardia thraciensis]
MSGPWSAVPSNRTPCASAPPSPEPTGTGTDVTAAGHPRHASGDCATAARQVRHGRRSDCFTAARLLRYGRHGDYLTGARLPRHGRLAIAPLLPGNCVRPPGHLVRAGVSLFVLFDFALFVPLEVALFVLVEVALFVLVDVCRPCYSERAGSVQDHR